MRTLEPVVSKSESSREFSGHHPMDPTHQGADRATISRWALAYVVTLFALGLLGLTGSSGAIASKWDPLLTESESGAIHELFSTSRAIRGDEYAVELPVVRAQQMASPSFPLVNLNIGIGQLQRTPYEIPVLDWGLVFRPMTWPIFIGSRWAHALHWFLRASTLAFGLIAWFSALAARGAANATEARRRAAIGALAAFSVLFSSQIQWFFGHAIVDLVAFACLAAFAFDCAFVARTPIGRVAWLALATWVATCGFFHFYAPLWAPVLWLLSGAIIDSAWRSTSSLLRATRRALLGLGLTATGVTISLLYYLPYFETVRHTVYPGQRIAEAGTVEIARLLDLFWPSLNGSAPLAAEPRFFSKRSWLNVCEASAVEVTPLFLLAALAVVNQSVRRASWRAIARNPGITFAMLVLAGWCWVPLPRFFGGITLLQWTPGSRAFFVLGVLGAGLATAVIAELEPSLASTNLQRQRWRVWLEGAVALVVVTAAWLLARQELAGGNRSGWGPIALSAVLLVASAIALRSQWGPRLFAFAWLLPLIIATGPVNPLTRSRDLFREGEGHRVVADTLRSEPGRLVDFSTHNASLLSAFGWPVLASVQNAPDLELFRFLAPDSPGLTENIYNRYAHVSFVLPPGTTHGRTDAFVAQISPCSRRFHALGVNHFLAPGASVLPDECASEFDGKIAGTVLLWTRRHPVGMVGAARGRPASTLDFDWSASGLGSQVKVIPFRDHLRLDLPAGEGISFAFPVNRSLVDEVHCKGASARALDAHLVFEAGPMPSHCEVDFLGTVGAVRRLMHPSSPPIAFESEPSSDQASFRRPGS